MAIASFVRAWLYIVPMIPSVLVTIFNLYHLLINRPLRTAVNNHVIIFLLVYGLFYEVTNTFWEIYLYYTGHSLSAAPAFCYIWAFTASNLFASISILMGWAAIERHMIVFRRNFFAAKTKRIWYHYVPLAICMLWPLMFYFTVFIILPCDRPLNPAYRVCNRYVCVVRIRWLSLFDSIAHFVIPAITTSVFSVALLVRSMRQRYRARGRVDWGNYKKMAAQLLPLSALYIFFQLPPMILYGLYAIGVVPYSVGASYFSDALFFNYWAILLTPFATVMSLPELKPKLRKLLFWRRTNAVRPTMMEMTKRNAGQTVARVPAAVVPVTVQPIEVPPAEVQQIEVPPTEVQPIEVPPAEVQPVEVPPAEVQPVEVESVNETPDTEAAIVNPPVRIIPVQVINITPLTPVEI